MDELIQDPNAVQPTQTAAPAADAVAQTPTAPVPTEPTGGPSTTGTETELIQAEQDANPESELVTPEEQAQYEDFVTRAISYISDKRKPGGKKASPLEATLNFMRSPKRDVALAVGEAAAHVTQIIANAAQSAKQAYPPDVLFHGGTELVEALYLLGSSHGVFQGVPEIDPEGAWPPEADELLDKAFAVGVQKYGEYLEKSGQLTPELQEQAQKYWKDQIAYEVSSGKVDDSVFDGVDINAARAQMHQQLNKQPQLVEE